MLFSTKHIIAIFLGTAAIATADRSHTNKQEETVENLFVPKRLGSGGQRGLQPPRHLKTGKGTKSPEDESTTEPNEESTKKPKSCKGSCAPSDIPSDSPSVSLAPSDVPSFLPSVSSAPSDIPSALPSQSSAPPSSPTICSTTCKTDTIFVKFTIVICAAKEVYWTLADCTGTVVHEDTFEGPYVDIWYFYPMCPGSEWISTVTSTFVDDVPEFCSTSTDSITINQGAEELQGEIQSEEVIAFTV